MLQKFLENRGLLHVLQKLIERHLTHRGPYKFSLLLIYHVKEIDALVDYFLQKFSQRCYLPIQVLHLFPSLRWLYSFYSLYLFWICFNPLRIYDETKNLPVETLNEHLRGFSFISHLRSTPNTSVRSSA